MSSINKPLSALLLTGTLISTGCSISNEDESISYDASPVINNLTDNVITATYQELNTQAVSLKSVIETLDGDDLSDGELSNAQTAWKATRKPWEMSEGFLIGPVDSLGIDPKLDTWPLDTINLETAIASGYSSNASEDVQGFHAIEYLLFGNGVSSNNRNTDLNSNERAYLLALMDAFVTQTTTLESAWTSHYNPSDSNTGPYASELKLSGSGLYSSQLAVMEELINGMIGIVDEVGNGKIADPFGTSVTDADTSLVESQYSWNSLTDFHNNLQSVLNIYSGKKGYNPGIDSISTSHNGIYAFVNAHDASLADRVLTEMTEAMNKIALIDGDSDASTTDISSDAQMPFREAIKDEAARIRIQDAIEAIDTLQGTLETEVLPLLSKTQFSQ